MLAIEVADDGTPTIPVYDNDAKTSVRHLELLIDQGYVKGRVTFGADDHYLLVPPYHLTWEGHDFLDAVRDDSVWNRATQVFRDENMDIASTAIEIVKAACVTLVKERLGIE